MDVEDYSDPGAGFGGQDITYDLPVCSRCGFDAIQVNGQWQHASTADAVFCAAIYGGSAS